MSGDGRAHRHVVVGDGVTAAALVEYRPLNPGDHLTVIGRAASRLGCGIAYEPDPQETPWRYAYLLNSPADDIDPAFAVWLERNWNSLSARMAGRKPDWLASAKPLLDRGDIQGLNAPRAFYGEFLRERTRGVLGAMRERGVAVDLIDTVATQVEPHDGRLIVRTETGRTISADSVDVAPGGPSTQRMDGDEGRFSAPNLFGNEARIAEHIAAGAEIFCVGANATMLDVLRLCQATLPENNIRFVACSPSGGLPTPLVSKLPRKRTQPDLSADHLTAESFLSEVRSVIETAKTRGEEMREVRAGFRAFFTEHPLSHFVPNPDEARRVPGTLRHWFRAGTHDTIRDFCRLEARGITRRQAGAVMGIEERATGATVTLRTEAGIETVETGFVVNCSGAGRGSRYDPLTEDMLARGWLSLCPISGGIEVGSRCETRLPGVRHLSPATSVIGGEVMPLPLYDATLLRTEAARIYA